MRHYQRRLPHWDTVDQPLFVTFRCAAASRRIEYSLPMGWPSRVRLFSGAHNGASGPVRFVAMDGLLDCGATGPLYLRRPEIAELVVGALQDGDRKFHRYALHAFVVMPNHVHVLVTPKVLATRWLAPLKGFTAYRANELLSSHGKAFWQDESYDHLVRSQAQLDRIRAYVEENPVTAGLVAEGRQYPWSSAAVRLKGGCGQDWPPHIL